MSLRIAVALLLLIAGDAPAPPVPRTPPAATIRPATPETLERLVRASTRPVVVNYWATWCKPCVNEMPRLVDAARRHEGRVDFVGVDVEDVSEEAAAFLRRYDVPYPNVADPMGRIRRAERVLGLPFTQFYSPGGELAFVHNGEIQEDELERKIGDLLRASRRASPPGGG